MAAQRIRSAPHVQGTGAHRLDLGLARQVEIAGDRMFDRGGGQAELERGHICPAAQHAMQHAGCERVAGADTIDDVAIRSYLLHLKLNGARRSILQRTVDSLKRFYDWAQTSHLIAKSPFDSFDFSRPLLGREQIRRREETRFANPTDREIAHLRALNHLAEHLNRSVYVRTLSAAVVQTLIQAMGFKTA